MKLKEKTIARTDTQILFKSDMFISVETVKVLIKQSGFNGRYEVHHIFEEGEKKLTYSVHYITNHKITCGLFPLRINKDDQTEEKHVDLQISEDG